MGPQAQTLPGTQHWLGLLLLAPAGDTDFRVLRDVSDAQYVLFPLFSNVESFRHPKGCLGFKVQDLKL